MLCPLIELLSLWVNPVSKGNGRPAALMPLQLLLFEVSVPPCPLCLPTCTAEEPWVVSWSTNKSWIRQQESINLPAFCVHHCCFYIQPQNTFRQCKLKNIWVYAFIFVCIFWWITYCRFLISPNGCLIHQFSWLGWNTLATNPSLFSEKRYCLHFCRKNIKKKKLNKLEYHLKVDTILFHSSFMLT